MPPMKSSVDRGSSLDYLTDAPPLFSSTFVAGPCPVGLDQLVTTKHGVMGVDVDWPNRDDAAGYNRRWSPDSPVEGKSLFAFDAAKKIWNRLGKAGQPSPQNLYEQTSLAYDSQRDQVLLHGGGGKRDELWAFDLKTNRWLELKPKVAAPAGAAPPGCNRESVYIPGQDVMITYGPGLEKRSPALWAYKPDENAWYGLEVAAPPGIDAALASGQNRALVYDPKRDMVFVVLGTRGGPLAEARVFALRYRHGEAKFVK